MHANDVEIGAVIVTWVYGIIPGFMTLPRQFVANLINGIASYRAIQTYLRQRFRGEKAHWEKTVHKEGVGAAPVHAGEVQRVAPHEVSFLQVLTAVYSQHVGTIVEGLSQLPQENDQKRQRALKQRLFLLVAHPDYRVRAALPRALAQLSGKNTKKYLLRLLFDRDWVVRANAARIIVNTQEDDRSAVMKFAFRVADFYGREVLLRAVENRRDITQSLRNHLDSAEYATVRDWIIAHSLLLRRATTQPDDHKPEPERGQDFGGFSESFAA